MQLLKDYLTAVCSEIKSNITQLHQVVVHPGKLQKRISSEEAPAAYITLINMGEIATLSTGQQTILLQVFAFLLVHSEDSIQGESIIQDLASQLLEHISGQRWKLPFVNPAAELAVHNLYALSYGLSQTEKNWRSSPLVEAKALDLLVDPSRFAFWGVSWEQNIQVGGKQSIESNAVPPLGLNVSTGEGGYLRLTPVPKYPAQGVRFIGSIKNRVDMPNKEDVLYQVTGSRASIDPPDSSRNRFVDGNIQIVKAITELEITHYVIYWGSDDHTKLTNYKSIIELEKTGEDLLFNLLDVPLPEGAHYLLVFTGNKNGEMETGVHTSIIDTHS